MKAPVLKTGIPQGIGGSNPSPSATHPPPGWPPGAKSRILGRLEQLGEVAESAEGSRLLSGYRVKSSVQGSNPCLSAKKNSLVCLEDLVSREERLRKNPGSEAYHFG